MSHDVKNKQVTREAALRYHQESKPGKIETIPTKAYASQYDLSLAYSPGVAYPCLEIKKNPADVYNYTNRGNLIGVISNGTAVLGLGNIGPLASKPVMEGKALLFKIFAGLDCFDIELDASDPDRFVETVKALEPTFGGINLEDIKAPECFEIEERLKRECNIPVMHDDQHGTAIISGAGLINALEIQGKNIADIRLVVNGAGAAAISCTKLYIALGVRPDNIVMCDSKGVIRADNPSLSSRKREFATTRDIHTLADAMVGADVFLGLSVKDVLTSDMVRSMAEKPIVFALANPDPEISYEAAKAARPDLIFATGRSDYPNQINNVLGFPYIFRGALDCGATAINEPMKLAAVKAIAELAKEPVPLVVDKAYGMANLTFGPEYILPKALDPRLLARVAPVVARAAEQSGVATRPITDYEAYDEKLAKIMGRDSRQMRGITDMVRGRGKRIVLGEGNTDNMILAADRLRRTDVCRPILLGNAEMIARRAAALDIRLDGIEVINPRHDSEAQRRRRYADMLFERLCRDGVTRADALERTFDRNVFGIMMIEAGDADAFLAGTYSASNDSVARVAQSIVGLIPGYSHFAAMHIVTTRMGTFYLADTGVNTSCDAETLTDVTRLADRAVRFFAKEPVAALVSYGNFGSDNDDPRGRAVSDAVATLHRDYPRILVDGEMQITYALNRTLRDEEYPFNRLRGRDVNTLIFPDLASADCTFRMMLEMGVTNSVGPIQLGLNRPIHFIPTDAAVADIVNLATVAALDAVAAEHNASR